MIRLLDRHLIAEYAKLLVVILLVLSLVLSALGFVRMLERVSLGDLNADVVLPLIGYQLLYYLPRAIPAAFFLAILAVMGRMYRDSEMTALAACGVGPGRIYRALGLGLVPLVALTAWLALFAQPWAGGHISRILVAQQERAAELAGLRPGRFNEYAQGDLVFYVESFKDRKEMENVFIQNRQHGKLGLVTARVGRHRLDPETGGHLLILEDGRRYEGEPGTGQYSVAEFDTYSLRIAEENLEAQARQSRNGRPSAELAASPDIQDRAELQERMSYPLSLITLALIAIPLSRSLPRQGLQGRLLFAFLVYFAFFNLHALSVSWMKKQVTPDWLGIWWAQGIWVGLALLALGLDSRWPRRLARRLRPRLAGT